MFRNGLGSFHPGVKQSRLLEMMGVWLSDEQYALALAHHAAITAE